MKPKSALNQLIYDAVTGSFLGTAFFHLIPEAVEMHIGQEHVEEIGHIDEHAGEEHNHIFLPSYFILFGILLFYIIEKLVAFSLITLTS